MTKKSKPLNPEQFQQLLIATANLPFIHLERPETDFILQVLETPINLQMRAEVVVKALDHFRQNVQVQHGIHTFTDLEQVLKTYPDTEAGNKEYAAWLWNNQHWTRIELLRRFMAFLKRHDLTDLDKLTAWAHKANFERDFQGQVKGMGLAAFNWLLLRLGVAVRRGGHRISFARAGCRSVLRGTTSAQRRQGEDARFLRHARQGVGHGPALVIAQGRQRVAKFGRACQGQGAPLADADDRGRRPCFVPHGHGAGKEGK